MKFIINFLSKTYNLTGLRLSFAIGNEEVIKLLKKNMVDVLRQKIENIYYRYKDERTLPIYVHENLQELYKDYTEAGGNHYIGKLYNRMSTWKVLEDDYIDENE